MTFALDIAEFVKKANGNVDSFMLEFSQDLAEAVVTNTPVKTGFLRAQWNASLNTPDYSVPGGSDAAAAFSRIGLNLQGVKGTDTVFITNGTKYGPYVEFGTSRMAARAFVRGVVNRARSIAEAAAARVRAKNG